MLDTDIIHHLEETLGISLKQVTSQTIVQKEDWGFLKGMRAYTLDEQNQVQGISLDYLSTTFNVANYLLCFKNLTFLSIRGSDYEDYTFLQKLIKLTYLDISHTQVSDLSFLNKLKNLTTLDLSFTQVNDPSSFNTLEKLTTLNLRDSQINDLSTVNKLENLDTLNLRNTQITDFSFLTELKNLTVLDLSYTQVSDILSFNELQNLTILDLRNTQIKDITFLSKLKKLTMLYLSRTTIDNFSSIKELKKLTTLHLSDLKVNDLSFLRELKGLTKLVLGRTQISDLSPIKELKKLSTLDLRGTNISDLSSIKEFKNLTTLNLGRTQVSDISPIKELKNLIALNLWDTQVTDLSFLREFKNLTTINLSRTQVSDLSSLKELKNLTTLNLWGTQVSNLSFLRELKKLTTLDLSRTQINDLSPINELKNLIVLDLRDTQVSNLSPIKELKNLTMLDLRGSKVNDLSPIKDFKNLVVLDLIGTQVNDLTPIKELHGLYQLSITPERLTNPPQELAAQGWKSIRNYFRQLAEQGKEKLHEAKILIVGEPDAGKTTLMKKLFDENTLVPDNTQRSTLGIDINLGHPTGLHIYYPGDRSIILTANLWDFGGQDIQYMLHQYFLRPDSLYVLVSDDRKANTRFDYWFQIIRLLGCEETKSCTVIVVLNKINYESIMHYDQQKYQQEFPELTIRHLEVDLAQNDMRWESLKELIIKELTKLSIMNQEVPRPWKPIREALEKRKAEKYIEIKDFFELCALYGLNQETDALVMLRYFDRIGVALHFEKDENLCTTVFLDPNWITKAIYMVLSDKNVEISKGKFEKNWLFNFWTTKGYRFQEQNLLLQLMLKDNFDICYPLPGQTGIFIVPMLLPNIKPKYQLRQEIFFRYQYSFMPKGIISRLTVRLHAYIEGDLVWQDGVLLSDLTKGCHAEVAQKETDRIINICIAGNNINHRRDMLTIIRNEIDYIHRTAFPGIHYSEMVACNCKYCEGSSDPFFFSLQTLFNYIFEKNKKTIECHKSGKSVSIEMLIGAFLPMNTNKKEFVNIFQETFPAVKRTRSISFQLNSDKPINIAAKIADIEGKIEVTELELKESKERKDYLDKKATRSVNIGISLFIVTELGIIATGTLEFFFPKTNFEQWAKILLIVVPGLLTIGELIFRKPLNEYILDKIKEKTSKRLYIIHSFSLNKYNTVIEYLQELRDEKKELLAKARNT